MKLMLTLARFPGLKLEYLCISCFFFYWLFLELKVNLTTLFIFTTFLKKQTLTAFQPLKLVFANLFRTLFAILNC